jgi:small conductance mechanosensitive channel
MILLLSLVQHHPLVLDRPKTTCYVSSISPMATTLSLRPWCTTEAYEQVRSEILQVVQETLREGNSSDTNESALMDDPWDSGI